MAPRRLSDGRSRGVLWWTFEHQTRLGHALVAVAGFAVWLVVYAVWLEMVGGGFELAATSGTDALAARRGAIRAASVACWLWFSLAVMAGKGGPFLDVGVYPTGALVLGPYLAALAGFGRLPDAMFTAGSPVSLRFVLNALGLVLPGFVASLVVLGGFVLVKVYVTGTHQAWVERHLPAEWLRYAEAQRER